MEEEKIDYNKLIDQALMDSPNSRNMLYSFKGHLKAKGFLTDKQLEWLNKLICKSSFPHHIRQRDDLGFNSLSLSNKSSPYFNPDAMRDLCIQALAAYPDNRFV